MILNDAGKMVAKWYHELQNNFPDIKCDDSAVMPNHFHGVIMNVGADLCVCPEHDTDFDASQTKTFAVSKNTTGLPSQENYGNVITLTALFAMKTN